MSWTHLLVETKTIASSSSPKCCDNISSSFRSLSVSLSRSTTCCVTSVFAFAAFISPMWTCTGRWRKSKASCRTAFGQVALNNKVCRSRGHSSIMRRICGSKPISSIRSASSSVKYEICPSQTCLFSQNSLSRPGVATMMWQPRFSHSNWSALDSPPVQEQHRIPEDRPKRRASSWICRANSLVGAKTNAIGPSCTSAPLRRICAKPGPRNARVLPLPLLAMPIRSCPLLRMGQHCA
mmetsp:Transcript_67900/g.149056  ORF Transcript_67900/g.149056 Transcript_67900/m.149056 type:complete len:237 (+) Transcript_67900:623-1333(+)